MGKFGAVESGCDAGKVQPHVVPEWRHGGVKRSTRKDDSVRGRGHKRIRHGPALQQRRAEIRAGADGIRGVPVAASHTRLNSASALATSTRKIPLAAEALPPSVMTPPNRRVLAVGCSTVTTGLTTTAPLLEPPPSELAREPDDEVPPADEVPPWLLPAADEDSTCADDEAGTLRRLLRAL